MNTSTSSYRSGLTVFDIREQYPLTPIELTMDIAKKANIVHPHFKGENVVMSSDFMLSVANTNGQVINNASTIKPINKLTRRTIELFEIERRYYREIGLEWTIVYDTAKPLNLIKNIDWLYDAKYLGSRSGIDQELVNIVSEPMFSLLSKFGTRDSLSKTCLKCDAQLGLEAGSSLFIVQHMLANKRWKTDMNQLIRESKPLEISLNESMDRQTEKYA